MRPLLMGFGTVIDPLPHQCHSTNWPGLTSFAPGFRVFYTAQGSIYNSRDTKFTIPRFPSLNASAENRQFHNILSEVLYSNTADNSGDSFRHARPTGNSAPNSEPATPPTKSMHWPSPSAQESEAVCAGSGSLRKVEEHDDSPLPPPEISGTCQFDQMKN